MTKTPQVISHHLELAGVPGQVGKAVFGRVGPIAVGKEMSGDAHRKEDEQKVTAADTQEGQAVAEWAGPCRENRELHQSPVVLAIVEPVGKGEKG